MAVLSNIITPTNVLTSSSTSVLTNKSFGDNPVISAGVSGGVAYLNGSKVLTTGSALQFDGSNLGLGVTPSAWLTAASTKAMQIGNLTLQDQASGGVNYSYLGSNYYQGTDTYFKYTTTNYATQYEQSNGRHIWRTAPSGTAGNAISFTQAMTLDASGNLGIGTTSTSSYKLTVNGSLGATTITETSALALKENFRVIEDPLNKVIQLVGKIYDRKDGSSKNEVGLVADEVVKVIPELVKSDAAGNPEGVNYTRLTVYLLESIKALKQEINELKAR